LPPTGISLLCNLATSSHSLSLKNASVENISPSCIVNMDSAIQSRFCDQVRRYGHELLSFVAQELGFAPAALSITLERIDLPPNEVNWVWFVGSVDTATEQAILRFFQTDAGRRALLANGPDPLEFKLATTLLRLPASQAEHPLHPDLPAHLTAAVTPLPGDQEVIILSGPSPEQYVRGTGGATGWLQTFPHMQFSEVLYLHLRGQLQSTSEHLTYTYPEWPSGSSPR
jgi:hypothetical protein